MGYLSTCEITAEDALEYIKRGISNLTNEEMEDLLCSLYSDKLYLNFRIVSEYDQYKARQFCHLKVIFDKYLEEKGKE